MGIESSIKGVTLTVTGGIIYTPHCYVTVCYGVLRNCYANRGLRLLLKAGRNIKTAKCYGEGVTLCRWAGKRTLFQQNNAFRNANLALR
jgi:hypothetical protein